MFRDVLKDLLKRLSILTHNSFDHSEYLLFILSQVESSAAIFFKAETNAPHQYNAARDARPAPTPGEMAAPGRPGPENFQQCPAPPRGGRCLLFLNDAMY